MRYQQYTKTCALIPRLCDPGTVPTIPSKFFDLGSPAQLAQAPAHPTHQHQHMMQGMSPRPSTVPVNGAAAGALLGEISFTALPQVGGPLVVLTHTQHFFLAFYVTIQVVWPHDPYWSRPHLSGKANQRSRIM